MKIRTLAAFATVATIGGVIWNSDFVQDNNIAPDMAEGWDSFTTPEPVDRSQFANVVKNPLGLAANSDAFTSVVGSDRRDSITMDKPAYDAVGRLVILINKDGSVSKENIAWTCTSTISEVDGYKADLDLIISSGHCFDFKTDEQYKSIQHSCEQPSDIDCIDDYIKRHSKDHLRFVTDYVDESGIKTYISRIDSGQFWNTTTISGNVQTNIDFAVATLSTPVPSEITPALAVIDYSHRKGQIIEVIGYGARREGLSTHIGAKVRHTYADGTLETDADLDSGASGGKTVIHNDGERLTITATNSSILEESKWTWHQTIYSDLINAIDFLKPTNKRTSTPPEPQTNAICVTVEVDTLNIRSGPGTSYSDIGNAFNGQTAYEMDNVNGWSLVALNGVTGWMANRISDGKALSTRFPCRAPNALP